MPTKRAGKSQLNLYLDAATSERIDALAEHRGGKGEAVAAAVHLLADPAPDWAQQTLGLHDGPEPDCYLAERIRESVTGWANAIGHAMADNATTFSRQEWNYLADVLNGCMADPSHWPGSMYLVAEVQDAHSLNGTGERWFTSKPDAAVRELLKKLAGLDYVHTWAVILAVRWFWDHSQVPFDHQTAEWWTVRGREAILRRHAEGE